MGGWGRLLLSCLIVALAAGAGLVFFQEARVTNESSKGEEVMTANVQVDPKIDLNSSQEVSIIVIFKTKPARTAVEDAKKIGVPLTLEQAEQDVKESHQRFQAEVKKYLGGADIPYTITHTYTAALNGVAMTLPADAIKVLVQSEEIESIRANREINIIPPVKPS